MDTVTQALLGSTVGLAVFGRRLGVGRALIWGAVAGTVPDLDIVATAPFGEFARMEHHRGISHSLLFGPVVGGALGWVHWSLRKRKGAGKDERLRDWMGLWILGLATHPLLDLFTTYGTQLFAPLTNHRFAIHGIGIVDPAYSLVLLAAVIAGLLWRRRPRVGKWTGWSALALTTSYLFYGLYLNAFAADWARQQLRQAGVEFQQIHAYPTVMQLWLRRIVVTAEDEYRVGYVSTLRPGHIEWFKAPRQPHALVQRAKALHHGQLFTWFASGMVAGQAQETPDGFVVELDDIRYGFPPNADQGMWGVRATFDAQGNLVDGFSRFRRPMPAATGQTLGDLWGAAFGFDPCTFKVGLSEAPPRALCARASVEAPPRG